MSMGWKCPGCGGCYSPTTSACPRCCAPAVAGGGTAPIVVPSVFSPGPYCTHPVCEETTTWRRCKACGSVVWAVLPLGADVTTDTATYTTETITHCRHGRRYDLGSCHECQRSYTATLGES